jgi:hypothetical protein
MREVVDALVASRAFLLSAADPNGNIYFPKVKNMPTAANAIIAVANQPNILRSKGKVK